MVNLPGRATPIPGHRIFHGVTNRQDKAELRAAVSEAADEFTLARRKIVEIELRSEHPEWDDETIAAWVDHYQPWYEDYDPVVAMTIIAVDHRNPPELRVRANAEVAQYLRPKLKSIEVTIDPASDEATKEREALAARLVELLDTGAAAKRATIDVTPNRPATTNE